MSKFRIALGAIALIAATGAASAADLARPYYGNNVQAVQPSLLPGMVWTGGYVGAQVGYSSGSVRWSDTSSFDADGFIGGVHGGYNWQVNQLVYGLEASANWTGADGSKTCAAGATCSADVNWTGDIRGRLGYAFDRAHLFAAAGLAYASLDAARSAAPGPIAGDKGSTDNFGWTIGVGGEYALNRNVILGVEYKYSDFGKDDAASTISNVKYTSHVIQARASYKF